MDYIPGYRCPVCGSKLYQRNFENSVLVGAKCDFQCEWEGKIEEAERVSDTLFEFEKYFSENENRFHYSQFDDIEIALSCFLAGMDYQRLRSL